MYQIVDLLAIVLPTVIAVVSVQVAIKLTKGESHKGWWTAIIVSGFLASVLTGISQYNARKEHQKEQDALTKSLNETKDKLDRSLQVSADMGGQLKSMQLMIGNGGLPDKKEFALVVAQLAATNQQRQQELGPSTVELCDKARDLASRIRDFQQKYDTDESRIMQTEMQESRTMQDQGKSQAEMSAIWNQNAQAKITRYQNYDQRFRAGFMSDAKYYRDLMLDRIPKEKRDFFIARNSTADTHIENQLWNNSFVAYEIAAYLDELANGVCPRPQPVVKAKGH